MTIKSDPITVGPVVLAYTDSQATALFTPRKNSGGRDTYGCSIIFGDQVQAQLKAIIDQVGAQAFQQQWGNPQANLHRGIHSTAQKPPLQPAGAWYANVSSGYPPQVVDAQRQPIINTLNPETGRKPVYDGVIAYVNVTAYDFSTKQYGVALGLNAVMIVADGQPLNLGSGVSVDEAFGNVNVAMAQPQGQPPQPGYPPQGQPQGQPPQPGYPPQGQPPQPAYPPQGQPPQPGYPPQGQPQGQPIPPFDPNAPQ